MSVSLSTPGVDELSEQLDRVIDRLLDVDLTVASDEQLLGLWRSIESVRRRLDPIEFRLINRAIEINMPFTHGCANPAVFIRQLFTISPAQARTRVKDAAAFGPRHDQYGVPLAPIFDTAAAAVTSGAITVQAARSIQKAIERLPHEISAEIGVDLEKYMVAYARKVDATEAGKYADELAYRFDQDGKFDDAAKAHKRRDLTVRRRNDGSATIVIEGTCELVELFECTLDATAKPQPAADGTPDPRTPGQRRHDGLLTALQLLTQSGRLPDSGGCRTTVVLHGDADKFTRGEGDMTTGHGYSVPVEIAKSWLEPEARAILVMLSAAKGIDAYSSVQRLFTEQQRLAMQARDMGCSYPECERAASWTQAHHVIDFAKSKRTRVDEGALVCGENHRTFETLGWRNIMVNGRPAWVPPTWVDPTQTPRTNTRHQPPDLPLL